MITVKELITLLKRENPEHTVGISMDEQHITIQSNLNGMIENVNSINVYEKPKGCGFTCGCDD